MTKVYVIQVIRSAGSVAANYIEANDNLGANDLKMRIRICKKESKETRLWLRHIETTSGTEWDNKRIALIKEANELMLIFASILKKLNDR